MSLQPGEPERHAPEESPVEWDLNRKVPDENEDWYREVVEHSHDLLCVHDLNGRFLSINSIPARLLGYSVEELLNTPMREMVDPALRERFDLYLREVERNGESQGLLAVRTRSGEQRVWAYHNTLRRTATGTPVVWGIAHDVTERAQAEKALRDSNEKLLQLLHQQGEIIRELTLFRNLVNQSTDGIQVIDPVTRRFLDVNDRACEELGYTREELLSMTVPDIDLEMDGSPCHRLDGHGSPASITIERIHRRKNGTTFPVEISLRRVRLDREYCVAVTRDITERKLAEQALRKSEARLRLAQEAAQVGMFERNLLTGESTWSPQMEAIYGLAPHTWPRSFEEFLRLVHPDDRELVSRCIDDSLERGEGKGEWRITWPDGSAHWISGRWRVFKDANGKSAHVIGMDFDITERKQTEEALRQSEERFRVALKNSPIAVFNQDRDLRYTWVCNSQLPFSASEKVGKSLTELFGPEEAVRIAQVRRRVLETGKGTRDETQFTYGGKKHYFDTTIEPLLDAGGNVVGITGASAEVTPLREATEALHAAKQRLTEEKLYLEQEIDTELGFGEVIGQSRALRDVMTLAGTVASSDATVLLLGETGTGKELMARAIHRLSKRSDNSFIKLNCAAIPAGLLESELFGSEKGAFTGSVNTKPGRVELADKGTLFLDEIGELPLDLQPKLLRVLQDREFERLGGTRTFQVDFRLIAATNRDLVNRVREGEFRSDLYYRLNVFPIRIPPLRERRDDIQLLVEYLVRKFARRMTKSITSIPTRTMEALRRWEWPGNIRELENFVERSVILTQGSVLVAPLSELETFVSEILATDETLARAERDHILRALQESHGQIGGVRGAAARLGLKRTTLQSKLKHLGINPHPGSRDH